MTGRINRYAFAALFLCVPGLAEAEVSGLDAAEFPSVKTVFYDYESDPASHMRGAYFRGSFVSAADDCGGDGERRYFLRRRFSIKSKPVEVWLQGLGDYRFSFLINGKKVLDARYTYDRSSSNRSYSADVSGLVKEGDNAFEAEYTVPGGHRGGVLVEILVRHRDGSVERISSDGAFESSSDGKVWKGVSPSPCPPTSDRPSRLNYTDYANPQDVITSGPQHLQVRGGQRISIDYDFVGRIPVGELSVRLKLRRGNSVCWNEELPIGLENIVKLGKGRWRLRVPFEVPLCLSTGSFEVTVESNSIYCRIGRMAGTLDVTAASCLPGYETPPHVEMKSRNGYPEILLNGRPFALLWGALQQDFRPDKTPHHSDMPLTAVTVHNWYLEWHPRMGVYDFAAFDRQAEKYRRAHPNAYFIWDLTVYPPKDFAERFPDEMASDDQGDRGTLGRFSWSYASKPGLAEIKEMIERAIRYLESSPYANRIIGYRVNSGTTIEWLGWDAKPGRVKDFSAPNRLAFERFALERYPQLRNAHIPAYAERSDLDSPLDILWDQERHMNAIAFMEYNSWIIAHDILESCGHAKTVLKELGRTKLVGTYYGYTFYLNANGNDQRRGHFALGELLQHNGGRVDFLMSPQCYSQRRVGDTCGDMKPFATLAANGILPVIEDDTRTHNRLSPTWLSWGQVHTPEQTEAVVARNGAIALCRMTSPYYYALCTGLEFSSPECARVGGDLLRAEEFCRGKSSRRAEVALVASEKSIVAMPALTRTVKTGRKIQLYDEQGRAVVWDDDLPIFNGEVFSAMHTAFSRCGAPVDYVLAEDLKNHPGDYRLYVFLNLFKCDQETADAVRRLRERGAMIVWIYAPGYLNGNSPAGMKELTGIDFAQTDGPGTAIVTMEDGRTMGTPGGEVERMFYPVRPDAVFGRYADGHPGVAAVKVGTSVSVFSGVWQLDQEFIARLVRESGAHVFCASGDPMEANDSLFTLHARFPGRKAIRLPRKVGTVVDVFGKSLVARDVDSFEFDAKLHSTHLFYYGEDGEELLRKLNAGPNAEEDARRRGVR